MVWQLLMRVEGPHRPDYDFADGDVTQVKVADLVSDWPEGFQIGTAAFGFGAPISAENVPTKIKWKSKENVYDYLSPHGASCISPRFRSLIESLEPGRHQFLPLEIVDREDIHLADHWIWVPCNRIDSVDRRKTTMVLRNRLWLSPPRSGSPFSQDNSRNARLVFSESGSAGTHFWRDMHIVQNWLLCSDRAAEAITASQLAGVDLVQKETV